MTKQQPQVQQTPTLVRVLLTCFIDERLRQPGDVVETFCPITEDGPFVDANAEIAPPRPKPQRLKTKSGTGGAGVPAPEWTTQGHREANNIEGPIGMQPGRHRDGDGIQVSPP